MKNFCSISFLITVVTCMVTCDDSIYEPCQSNLNLDCVRQYFKDNGDGEVVSEGNSNLYQETSLPVYVPAANLTAIVKKTYLTMEGEIEKFYIDNDSGNLIMSIYYENLICDAPGVILSVNQNGGEPIVVEEDVKTAYSIVLTAVVPIQDGLTRSAMELATVTAYLPNSDAVLEVGPKFSASDDPAIASSYESLFVDVPTTLLEIVRTKASYYFYMYLQNNICDYELEPALLHPYDTTVIKTILENNDQEPSISKPCDGREDLVSCIRDFFEEKSSCSAIRDPSDEPVTRDLYIDNLPWVNISAIIDEATMTGLDGDVREFYINEQTNNLVMSVAFTDISVEADMIPVILSQRGQIPKITVLDYFISDNVYNFVLTAVIHLGDGLTSQAVRNGVFSAHFPGPIDNDVDSMSADIEEDSEWALVFQKLRDHPLTTAKELAVSEARSVFRAYLQKYICDFEIPVDPLYTF